MEEQQKVKLLFEFERREFEALCFLVGADLPEEMWQRMSEKTIMGDCNVLDDGAKSARLLLASIALLSVEE